MSATPDMTAGSRKDAVNGFKRQLIRDAAKSVFAAQGIQAASLREIARSAGCTTGAIYSLYESKEELYADLLRESMRTLIARMGPAAAGREGAAAALRAMLDFYLERPDDYELHFYLYGGARPVGLRPDLDRQLNEETRAVIDLVTAAVAAEGLAAPAQAARLALSAMAQVFGIVLLHKTGRLKSWRQDAPALLQTYLGTLAAAAPAARRAPRPRARAAR
ncbi:MAG: TetR/AcrR family transcriptional regulator [Nevskia sp.]|nr:TetR/AcrR family transcriptional regulator [Nevskia sp.]